MIQVKNVQAKSRVKSKKRKKCRKFSGKIGGKFPEIFRKISNFSAEIFRLTSLWNPPTKIVKNWYIAIKFTLGVRQVAGKRQKFKVLKNSNK
jgi:hypothetical protein